MSINDQHMSVAKDQLIPDKPKKPSKSKGASAGARPKVQSLAEVKVDFSVQVQAWADAEKKAEKMIGQTLWDLAIQANKYHNDSVPEKRIREGLKTAIETIFGEKAFQTKKNRVTEICTIGCHKPISEIQELKKKHNSPNVYLKYRDKSTDVGTFSKSTPGGTTGSTSAQPKSWNATIPPGDDLPDPVDQSVSDLANKKHAGNKRNAPSKEDIIGDLDTLEEKAPDTFKELVEELIQEEPFKTIAEDFIRKNKEMFNLKLEN